MTGLEIVLALLLLVAVLFAVGYYLESDTVNQLRHDERLAAITASSETISREQLAKDYILKHEHKQMLAAAREDAITNSRAVNKGFVYEEMAPHWQKGFDPKDFHHMGAPIDYLIIDGANDFLEGRADNIRGVVLFEVKTGSGKTSLALSWISLYKQTHPQDDRPVLIVDVERTITPQFVEGFGLRWAEDIIFRRPDTIEEAFELILELGKSGLISFCLFDSVGAAQNQRQISRDVGDVDVGGISKLMHEVMRQLCKICEEHTTTAVFINHITMKPGVSFGNPETTPGGRALAYYASSRLRVLPMKPNPKNKGSGLARVKIMKHKTGLPYLLKGPIEFDFAYGKGWNVI